jgi:hypothetical protein
MTVTATTGEHSSHQQSSGRWYAKTLAAVLLIVALRLLLHLLTANRYGIFRDELYYYACSQHMDWGYVDMPPLIPAATWLFTKILGSSLFVLRLIPALSATATVALTGYLAFQFGGKRYAVVLATLAIAVSPVFVINGHLLGTNDFEPLLWMGCAAIVIRIVQTGNQKLWIWFGVLAGAGLQNKYSISIFGLGIVVGLVLSSERRALAHKWIWIGGVIAFLIFLPNFLWNVRHDWPFVQLMHNIHQNGRDVELTPVKFLLQQILMVNVFAFPLWVAGLVWLFFGREGRRYRVLGWAYIVTYAVIAFLHGKDYYLAPVYPMLFAAGSVFCESWIEGIPTRRWLKPALVLLLIVPFLAFLPIFAPVLSAEHYTAFQKAIHFSPPINEHSHARSPLPQYYSDELGWEAMVAEVARVYHSLPLQGREKTAIKARNYGQAGAIDYFGAKYGLPKAICEHQNYWFWGTHGYTGESMILLDEDNPEHLSQFTSHSEKVGHFEYPFALENFDIYYIQGLKVPLDDLWAHEKAWD